MGGRRGLLVLNTVYYCGLLRLIAVCKSIEARRCSRERRTGPRVARAARLPDARGPGCRAVARAIGP